MGCVVVVGSFNVDHVWTSARLPRPGETVAGQYRSGPGGKGFNQATAAARAGADTAFVCALGDDAGGRLARALAQADGIDLHASDSDAPTGTAGIHVDADGRNSIVIGPGANAALSPGFIERKRAVIAAAVVVVVQLESPVEAITAAFLIAREAGAITLFNPAPADAVGSPALWALADVVTPNETEFCAQLQRQAGESVDADALTACDDARLHAWCRMLLPHGSVVITLGAAGCFVSHTQSCLRGDAQAHYRITAQPVHAIDTTGAGDAFNGALAASLAQKPGARFAAHLHYASCYAALSTERAGAASAMPRQAMLRERFGDG
ncbi:MAG: ribokinase [Pseudomonadota bacterium]|nr:ribokinase [Pseudomonadota bacterium]